jgi:hypothetical protein
MRSAPRAARQTLTLVVPLTGDAFRRMAEHTADDLVADAKFAHVGRNGLTQIVQPPRSHPIIWVSNSRLPPLQPENPEPSADSLHAAVATARGRGLIEERCVGAGRLLRLDGNSNWRSALAPREAADFRTTQAGAKQQPHDCADVAPGAHSSARQARSPDVSACVLGRGADACAGPWPGSDRRSHRRWRGHKRTRPAKGLGCGSRLLDPTNQGGQFAPGDAVGAHLSELHQLPAEQSACV